MTDDFSVNIYAVVGHRKLTINQLLSIKKGTLIELDKLAGEPLDIFIQGHYAGYDEAVEIDENLGIRVCNFFNNEDN